MSERKRETSSTSFCARSRLFQKSGALIRASSPTNSFSSFGTSKKPPQLAHARLQIFSIDRRKLSWHEAKIIKPSSRAKVVAAFVSNAEQTQALGAASALYNYLRAESLRLPG